MNALYAGLVIKSMLLNSIEVNSIIQGRVYPIFAGMGTSYPFVLYCRNSLSPDDSKDHLSESDDTSVVVSIVSDSYDESIDLADKVHSALRTGQTSVEGIDISEIRLVGFDEDSQDEAYIQNLIFNIQFEN